MAVPILLGVLVGLPVYNTGVLIIRHEEVRIQSGDVELAATISVPRWGSGPFPAFTGFSGQFANDFEVDPRTQADIRIVTN